MFDKCDYIEGLQIDENKERKDKIITHIFINFINSNFIHEKKTIAGDITLTPNPFIIHLMQLFWKFIKSSYLNMIQCLTRFTNKVYSKILLFKRFCVFAYNLHSDFIVFLRCFSFLWVTV